VRRTLYWKRLLVVLAVTIGLSGGAVALHRVQTKSQYAVLKERAEQLAAAPATRAEALPLYERYTKLQPNDEAAFVRYAELLFAEAEARPRDVPRLTPRIETVLRAYPDHPTERRKLVRLYLDQARFTDIQSALAHAQMLLERPDLKGDADLLQTAAECELGLNNSAEALKYLEAAFATGRAPVKAYVRALEQYRVRPVIDRTQKMDRLLAELRSGRFKADLEARVAVARFEMLLKNTGSAREDLEIAFNELGGAKNPDALLARAALEFVSVTGWDTAAAHYDRAAGFLKTAFELDPKNHAVCLLYAETLAYLGKRAEGVAVLKTAAESLGPVNDQFFVLIDHLIDLQDQEVCLPFLEKLAADPDRKTFVTYCRGRLAVLKKEWATAAGMLTAVAPRLAPIPLYHKKAMLGLATCYAGMGNAEQQLKYCRLALRDDPGFGPALVGEAEALVKTKQSRQALERYRVIVNEYRMYEFRPQLVQLELVDVLARPGDLGGRDWARFDESLGPVAQRAPEVHIFHAQSLALRGQPAAAEKVLKDWIAAHPNDPKRARVHVAVAGLLGREGDGTALLDEAQKQIGDAMELRLARAAVLTARGKPPRAAEFDALAAGAEAFGKVERYQLLFGLGQAAAQVADRNGPGAAELRACAIAHLKAAAAVLPQELLVRSVLLDQAVAAGRKDVIEEVLVEMAKIETKDGPTGSLARVAIDFPEVKKMADGPARTAKIKELRALAQQARDLRPNWPRADIAFGQLDELEGLIDDALKNYARALERGDVQESVVRRTVELYRLKQQDEKAVGVLNDLAIKMRLPDDLERFRSIRNLLAAGVPQNERPTIDRVAPAAATDHKLQLLRGALLATIRDNAGALAAFRRAVELADRDPETWGSLVSQLVGYGKLDEAKRAVAEADKKLSTAPAATAEARAALRIALGGLYEMVGDGTTAQSHFTAARELAPLELNPTRQMVLFLQRTNRGDDALKLLLAAKDSAAAEVARWARRHLALTMVASPNAYAVRRDALALVEGNLRDGKSDTEDLKARAVIRTVDPETREEGVRELRKMAESGELTPDEDYLLGKLAFDAGDFANAETSFQLAARPRPGVTPEHLAALVRVYLAMNNLARAEGALERLKANGPTSWEAFREEARVLVRQAMVKEALGEFDDAKKLRDKARAAVRAFPGWDAAPNLAARSGPLFEELGFAAEAEAAYQKHLAAGGPTAHAPLAVFYVRQKEVQKAIDLARKYEKGAPPLLTGRILAGAVRAKRPDPSTEADVVKWLDDAQRAAAGDAALEAALIGCRAELLDAQGKHAEALAEYAKSLAKAKSDLMVNNYCVLLALVEPRRAGDGLKLMNELIGVRGPVPAFLDSRALLNIALGNPADAEKDVRLALVQHESAAYRFHLGWALDLDGKDDKRPQIAKELEQAKRLGLTAADLHPLELKRYAELMTKFKLKVD
jgi:tetratricopeptide (TPR) repeat protein